MARLEDFVRQEFATAPTALISEIAADLSAKHHDAGVAALFYGSCLRDNVFEDRILDFYLLVDSYALAHGSRLAAFFNWLLPPNVYYAETLIDGVTYRSKYAVLTLDQFRRMCSAHTLSPYIWARFCQPAQIVPISTDLSPDSVLEALISAIHTMVSAAAPLVTGTITARAFWSTSFNATYRTELRAEAAGKGAEIYEKNRDFYDALSPMVLDGLNQDLLGSVPLGARATWLLRRIQGKILSVLKLAKATFTFANGVDYILWKVERHSGVHVEPTEWQRKHPLLSSITLSWKLWRQKGFR